MSIKELNHFLEGKKPDIVAFIVPAMTGAWQGDQFKHALLGDQFFCNGDGIRIQHHWIFAAVDDHQGVF